MISLATPEAQRVTPQKLAQWGEAYSKAATQHVAQRSVMRNGIMESSENIDVIKQLAPANFAFSVDVDSEAVANQLQSGRCWMFAGLNLLRWHIEKQLNLPHGTFELSQAYLTFYNKVERAAWFLENVVRTADKDFGDREVDYLFSAPMEDGGYWDWIAGLIAKYGIMPHSAMAETHCTNDTAEVNEVLSHLLRKNGLKLREMARKGEDTDAAIDEMLSAVYRVCAVCFGEPPQKFDFQYMDKDNKYHAELGLTPLDFLSKYVPFNVKDDIVAVSNFPGENRPYNRIYTIEASDQIPNGPICYLNVPMEDLKKLVLAQLDGGKGEPVWFASDVLADSDKMKGVMALDLYDMEAMFDIDFGLDKAQGLDTQQFGPDHAMMIAGVDIVDGKPAKWKIENSWGTTNDGQKTGHNGYFVGSDAWFDDFVYVAAVKKSLLSDEQKKVLETDPIVLPFYTTI